ncbi:glycosyltransferase [Microbacterium sp. zg.Y1090]|uniref:glycosyltransferase family 2 protein n=1 Tax=Microbacterium TaxID=33882 RepID=UPI00214BBB9E|nr:MULTISPECIES: glycosyltransferase family 2 protein [unclassified Microbacterium]MCR2813604.1 glycosyltransferase [Microbacterium sp. zg.Y1084]MCR2818064.1 glycosyltransferase [Microbacterium sp. zg.Y1090]MDL5486581.1 glycosyltransferase family 2 protein [Microbacterium sp. zg-Y1211]WIM27778.1 glycosyltransferase family 2 protein [Microbacterium sp. zg-Y1090]
MNPSTALSVVVPAYNNAATIRETIESILAQDGVDFELVIADHASSDGTRRIAAEFAHDRRVRIIDTPAGGGAARNWNRVTQAANGIYLKLVCGDDVLRPGVLARQVALLQSSDAVLTASRRDIIDARGRTVMSAWGLRGIDQPLRGTEAARRALRAGSNVFGEPASVMMRRSALVDAGGWFDAFPYLIDQATYTRVLESGGFIPDPQVGATFRLSSGQWSVALTRSQARQARAFHAWFRDRRPDIVSRLDLIQGDIRATTMAHLRRLSYTVLKRRM